jgi:DNA replication protein DnaC
MIEKLNITPTNDVCPYCGGLGMVAKDVPVGHADFGKAFPCICQKDKQKATRLVRLRKLGNMDAFQHRRFDTFQIDYTRLTADEQFYAQVFPDMDDLRRHSLDDSHRAQINAAAELAFRYADGEYLETPWLLLKGSYGTGKTHLAAAVANFRIENGEPALFITVPDLLDHLRSAYGPSSELAYDETFEQVREAPLLILDDLGAESPTAWALEKLYQLFGHRHARRLPTIITTNVEPEAFDPRIRSRLLDQALTQICPLNLPDRRSPNQTWGEMDLTRLDRHSHMTFANFDLRTDEGLSEKQQMGLRAGMIAAKKFTESPPRNWLVLIGPPGSGKTHLAAASAFDCNQRGRKTLFVTVGELINHLRSTFYPGSTVRYDKRLEEIKKAPTLVLDDLTIDGKSVSAWAKDKLYEILLHRFDYDLPTLITTNQNSDDMDLRLRSRLQNEDRVTVVSLEGVPAYRGRSAKRTPTR